MMDIDKKIEAIKAKLAELQNEFTATPQSDRFWIEQEIDDLEFRLRQTEERSALRYG